MLHVNKPQWGFANIRKQHLIRRAIKVPKESRKVVISRTDLANADLAHLGQEGSAVRCLVGY